MDSGNLPVVVAMFVSAAAMLAGYRLQKSGRHWGNLLVIIGAAVVLGCAGWSMLGTRRTGSNVRVERIYAEVSGRKLGSVLAAKFPGARALVIVDPNHASGATDGGNPVVDGLRAGFGDKISVVKECTPVIPGPVRDMFTEMASAEVASPDVPPLDIAAVPIPPNMWFTPELFDEIVDRYKDRIDLVVSTIGLPDDVAAMDFWQMQDRPELALLGGSLYELKNAFAQGAVCAAVAEKPDAEYSGRRPPRDLDAAFDKRFLLVTTENTRDIASTYSRLFR